jgi:hypothetical protein
LVESFKPTTPAAGVLPITKASAFLGIMADIIKPAPPMPAKRKNILFLASDTCGALCSNGNATAAGANTELTIFGGGEKCLYCEFGFKAVKNFKPLIDYF